MNIAEKMKHDWDQRAQHHARFWIATENYQTEESFAQSGQENAHALLQTLTGLHQPSWKILDIGCGIGRILKPLAEHPNITTFATSGVDLREFNDQSFNLVYSYVAFQHMPRPVFEQYLGEINRVLTPEGYLAMQLPIGQHGDVPIEDTIGIRSYPIQEIEQKLFNNGLVFCNKPDVYPTSTTGNQPFDHRFHIIKKIKTITFVNKVEWVQLEHPQHPSPLDMQLYETYANNCVKKGNSQEGIKTLRILVNQNPGYLEGWLQLAALFLETGKVQQAITTLQELTALYPSYQEGQATLQQLLAKCKKEGTTKY